jgi:hypothetical protein
MQIIRRIILVIICLVPTSLWGQFIVRPVNLAYLSRRAGVIVQGRIVNVQYEPMPGYEHIPTVRVTLAVDQMLRGPQTKQYTFRQLMPSLHPRGGKYGAYQTGSEMLLFLVSPSEYGLSSPIGAEQGMFRIQRDRQGRRFIANGFGNNGIFNGVESDAEDGGLTLSRTERETAAHPGAIDADRFMSLVRTLMRMPRIE